MVPLFGPGISLSENVVKLYAHILGRFSGDIPPPRSRIRIVTPGMDGSGVGVAAAAAADDGSGGELFMIEVCVVSVMGSPFTSGAAAIVISTASRSFPFSTVARNAFFNSSVRMYSTCVGTWAKVVST